MAQELKNRNEMDARWQWRLDHIFETEAAFEAAMEEAKKDIEEMKKWQGRVAEDPRQAIRDSFAGSLKIERLMAYASMHKDEDSSDPVRQARSSKVGSCAPTSVPSAMLSSRLRPSMSRPSFLPWRKFLPPW